MLTHERQLWTDGYERVAGLDLDLRRQGDGGGDHRARQAAAPGLVEPSNAFVAIRPEPSFVGEHAGLGVGNNCRSCFPCLRGGQTCLCHRLRPTGLTTSDPSLRLPGLPVYKLIDELERVPI